MKGFVATAAAVALAASVALPAAASATPTDRRVAALEAQVKVLRAQVKVLRAQVRVLGSTIESDKREFRDAAARSRVGDACMAIAVADLFQSTWTNLDGRVGQGSGFGAQSETPDVACNAIGVARPGIQGRPSVAPLWGLVGWLIG